MRLGIGVNAQFDSDTFNRHQLVPEQATVFREDLLQCGARHVQ